ncbi:MAG TPA: hypothetical protein VMT00_00955 [Thermoanaerobaculia bacterium]|nr:hypothetical protein [Thermoanaerobaculia bacterium]
MRRRGSVGSIMVLVFLASTSLFAHGGHRGHGVNMTLGGDSPFTSCSQVRIEYHGTGTIRGEQTLTVPGSSPLRISAAKNGGIGVQGHAGANYEIQLCKAAAADSGISLDQVTARLSGGELTVDGPARGEWTAYLIVMAPRNATLALESTNGPISLYEVSGDLEANAVNGPIGIKGVSGALRATAQNGPISIARSSGDLRVETRNGPLSVKLDGMSWEGKGLDARTKNGPLSLQIPDGYRSGVVVEALGRGPVNCKAEGCYQRLRHRDEDEGTRRIELGGARQAVYLSTVNGPVSVKSAK